MMSVTVLENVLRTIIRDRSLIIAGGGRAGAKWGRVTNFHAREKGGGHVNSCKKKHSKFF